MEEISKELIVLKEDPKARIIHKNKFVYMYTLLDSIFAKRLKLLIILIAVYSLSFFFGLLMYSSGKMPFEMYTFGGKDTHVFITLFLLFFSGYTVFGKINAILFVLMHGMLTGLSIMPIAFSTNSGEFSLVFTFVQFALLTFLVLLYSQELYVYSKKAFHGSFELFRPKPLIVHSLFTIILSVLIFHITIFLYNN